MEIFARCGRTVRREQEEELKETDPSPTEQDKKLKEVEDRHLKEIDSLRVEHQKAKVEFETRLRAEGTEKAELAV